MTEFLPPLKPFKIKNLQNITSAFKSELESNLINGLKDKQSDKILVIESKIIQFSLSIQEKINEIIQKQKLILHTANNVPYIENACCDTTDKEPIINYFTNQNNSIKDNNKIVKDLGNILANIRYYSEASLFYSNINTKNIYDPISNLFNEKTIYIAFIFYCKFKSLIPTPADLLPLCLSKPDANLMNSSYTIDKIITNLKDDNRNYTNEQFLRLLQLIGRANTVPLKLDEPVKSCIANLAIFLDNKTLPVDKIIDVKLKELLLNAISTFRESTTEYTKESINLLNYLLKQNEQMTDDITEFFDDNSHLNKASYMDDLFTWKLDKSKKNKHVQIYNNNMYNINNFYNTCVYNMVNVFPTIILNKVNYDNTSIPTYYNFSKNHMTKLSTSIAKYFNQIKQFYEIPTISKVLNKIKDIGENIMTLSKLTHGFSSIKTEDGTGTGTSTDTDTLLINVIDEPTSRALFEHYILRILSVYIDLTSDKNMITESSSSSLSSAQISGYLTELKEETADLLIGFFNIFKSEKEIIDMPYEEIQDIVFKLKEQEKHTVTSKLKGLSQELRDTNTALQIIKQGIYGVQDGLVKYTSKSYDLNQTLRNDQMLTEQQIRTKNSNANDNDIDVDGDNESDVDGEPEVYDAQGDDDGNGDYDQGDDYGYE